jgi:hypothetical protein
MLRARRLVSSILFAAVVVLIFAGASTTLGTSAPAMLASTVAVTALLYTWGLWFAAGRAGDEPSILVFNHTLMISGGPLAGKPVVSQFPIWMRSEIRTRCEAAIAGEYSRFTCADGLRARTFDAAPITNGDRRVVCGVLIEGAAIPAPTLMGEAALMPDAAI